MHKQCDIKFSHKFVKTVFQLKHLFAYLLFATVICISLPQNEL